MISKPFDLKTYRSILCLNGDLPERAFLESLNLPIIAADGAANALDQMGLSPEIIIGDLDSVKPEIRDKHKILFCPDQDSNDYQKALTYLKTHELLPAIVVGMNGGHLDHILNNINIFLETNSLFYAPPLIGYVLKNNTKHEVTLPFNTKTSLIGIPQACVSTRGLKWELNHSVLSFPGNTSCFNRTKSPLLQIEVHEGSVLILIYTTQSSDAGDSILV